MGRRLLIAAGASASDVAELPFGVRALIDAADEILVVTPTLPTRFEWLASATDEAREQADQRLGKVLGQLDELGNEAAGTLGADDPLLAFADAVSGFDPDHILISLRAGDRSGWQEAGLLDKVQAEFGLPMTVFSLPGE